MNLAVGDITYATFNIPQLVISHINGHPEGVAGRVLCIFRNGLLAWVGEYASVFTLVAIATERYYAVIYPLGNKGKLTIRKLKVTFSGSTAVLTQYFPIIAHFLNPPRIFTHLKHSKNHLKILKQLLN